MQREMIELEAWEKAMSFDAFVYMVDHWEAHQE